MPEMLTSIPDNRIEIAAIATAQSKAGDRVGENILILVFVFDDKCYNNSMVLFVHDKLLIFVNPILHVMFVPCIYFLHKLCFRY